LADTPVVTKIPTFIRVVVLWQLMIHSTKILPNIKEKEKRERKKHFQIYKKNKLTKNSILELKKSNTTHPTNLSLL